MAKKVSAKQKSVPVVPNIVASTPLVTEAFDLAKHVYKNDAFVELVKDAIRFFNGTPVHRLPPPEKFHGTGIYALYYTGHAAPYTKYAELNRLAYDFPIYIGKVVPKGWRQSRTEHSVETKASELYSRLNSTSWCHPSIVGALIHRWCHPKIAARFVEQVTFF